MKKLWLASVFALGLATTPASADTVLTMTAASSVGQPNPAFGPQSTSAPCVIAATNCSQPAGFGFNDFSPNSGASFDRYSTNVTGNVADGVQGTPYTVGQITGILGNTFNIVMDVNTTSAHSENLSLLEVLDLTTGLTLAHFTAPLGGANVGNPANNGNGFGDFLFSTVDFTGLNSGDQILFHAQWQNAVDGGESFFLKSAVPVPGPLAGAGIPGIVAGCIGLVGLARRRRAQSLDWWRAAAH
jgi:hypothetical protein